MSTPVQIKKPASVVGSRSESRFKKTTGFIYREYGAPTVSVALLFIIWQVAVEAFHVPSYFLPAPLKIINVMIAKSHILATNSWVTIYEILIGFSLSVIVGIPVAILITYSKTMEKALYPLLVGAQTIPKVAIAPLFVVWFGFGTLPKVLLTFLIAFFPIVVDSVVGFRSLRSEMIDLGKTMGASVWQMFERIKLPQAMPSIFGGLKIALTLAVVGAIVAEFVGADKGLGYLLVLANGNLDMPMLFATLIVLTIIGVISYYLIDIVESLAIPWHVSKQQEAKSRH